MTTILVTGSAGFIGFFVSKALLEGGFRVVGADCYNSYYDPSLKHARAEILSRMSGFERLDVDLSDQASVRRLFEEYRPELVFHSAAQAGVRYSLVNPHAYEQSNLAGFLNVLEEARLLPTRRFVYASSSSVYGGNTKMPYAEDDPVNTPVSLYAATKRSNELMAHTYTHLWGLQTVGLRFFTVYGPWGRPDMAYWSFLEKILAGRPIQVFNFGKNRRDFTYIDDIVKGVTAALFSEKLGPYEIINLGNNKPEGLMEFIEILEELSGKKAIKEMTPAEPGDVVATYADITRAREKLGFQPTTSLRQGLDRFVKWYLDHPALTASVAEFRAANTLAARPATR